MAQLINGTTIAGHTAIHAGNLSAHSIATTTYVNTQIANLVNSAPAALDTLNELAAALGNDASFATTINNSLSTKLTNVTGNSGAYDLNTSGQHAFFRFSQGQWSNAPVSGNYSHVLSVNGASDNRTVQVYLGDVPGYLWWRPNQGGTWHPWERILTSNNFNSWAPTLTGTGASGTWSINVTGSAGSVAWTNVSSRPTALSQFTNDLGNYGGFLTSLPSHNHDDRYYTESESDGRYLYYRGVNAENDFQAFQDVAGEIRFDQINDFNNLSNRPSGYQYGGVLSMRGANFGFQLWGSHTGDFFYKTQWSNDNYTGWRQVITSLNIGSQSVNFASSSSQVYHYASRTDGTWYNAVWATGNPSHMYSADSVQIRSSDGAIRANIFYDNQNTAYYVDPGSSSRLYLLGLGGATPDAALSVSGTAHVDGTLYLGGTAGTVNSWGTRTTGGSGYWRNSSRDVSFNNEGYGSTWTFAISSAGAVTLNRHIDANTTWGSGGTTIFMGWYGGKIMLGNNNDGAHDWASAIGGNSVVSTNKHHFYKGAYMKNNVDGAEVLAVDGVNGRLFTVTDSVLDTIYSVNTIAGLPIFEVMADNTVKIGKYGTSAIHVTPTGRTGFGTTDPQGRIHIYNASASNIYLESGTGGTTGKLIFKTSDNSDLAKYIMQEAYWTLIGTHSNEGFRVKDSSGTILITVNGTTNAYPNRVGIGANAPSYKLHVAGDIYADGGWLRVSGSSGIYFESYAGGWHMTEGSYVRSYNGKSLHMNGGSIDYVGSLYLQNGPGVHLQGNTDGSYGSLQITQSKNSWAGIYFTYSGNHLMMNGTEVGTYRNGYGWQWRWYQGTMYVTRSTNGGGTEYTVWDSGNLTNLNQLSNGPGYATQSWVQSQGYLTSAGSYLPYGNWAGSSGLNDYKLYLRTNGDNNHYLWNAADDWEELNAYEGTGFRITSEGGGRTILAVYGSANGGYTYSPYSFRAPIFYDSENTTYYGDFASTSWLRHLSVGDVNAANDGSWNARLNITGSYHARLDVKSNSDGIITTMFSHTGNGVGKIGTMSNHPLVFMVNGNTAGYAYANYLQGADSVRAPIFYDSDNTGYYVDPNGTSNLYYIQMPHLGNGSPNILVNNGGSENWGAIQIAGGSGNMRIGISGSGRSWSGRVSLAMHVGASESFRVHSDGWDSLFEVWGTSGYARTKGSLEVGSDIYLGTRGNWLSTYLNQAVRTDSSPSFSSVYGGDVYTSGGWFRNHSNNNGIYWSNTGWHLFPADGADFRFHSGSNSAAAIRMETNGTTRGYMYAENDNTIGFLNSSRNWSFRTYNNGDARIYGYLYVNGAGTSSSIFMSDSDEGQREIHCNSNRIGFLTQGGSWGAYLDDGTSWYAGALFDSDSRVAISRGEGRNYVDYSRYVYNNGGYSGSGWVEPSDLGVRYAYYGRLVYNNGAYSGSGWVEPSDLGVRYANSAGSASSASNASNLGGLGASAYLRDDGWNNYPGQDANTQGTMMSDFSYSNNCPWTGELLRFGASGYSLQLNSQYQGTGLSFRSRNGDTGSWNSWSTVIHSNNIGSQSVNYANSAGNADTVDGYHMNQAVTVNASPTFQEVYANGWFRSTGHQGHYNPTNGAHFYPNDNSYGAWKITGNRNGWGGINLQDPSTYNHYYMHESGNGGYLSHDRWVWYYHRGNNSLGLGESTTSSSYKVYVTGALYATDDIVAYSDRRKKTDIITIDNALEKVEQMRGVYYTKIDSPQKGRQTGVIAQEINEVLPEVVTYAPDVDEYGVSYGNIAGVLIEAIKEQQRQIADLKEEIKKLKGE